MEEKINNEVEETHGSAAEETTSQNQAQGNPKPIRVVTVIGIALVFAVFLISLILNVSLLSSSDQTSPISALNWTVIVGSLLIAGLGLGISFWIYYARTVYLKDGPALVPEKWGHVLAELGQITNNSGIKTVTALSALLKATNHQSEKSEGLLESFLTLQQAISSRDEEISRLKKGHDAKVFKRFVTRFIRVSIALEEIRKEANGSDQAKNFQYLCRLMQNALEECGVEQLKPEINADYREAGPEIADDPTIIPTDDENLDFKISSIEALGYVIEGEGDREIIIPAKVSIYKIQEGLNND